MTEKLSGADPLHFLNEHNAHVHAARNAALDAVRARYGKVEVGTPLWDELYLRIRDMNRAGQLTSIQLSERNYLIAMRADAVVRKRGRLGGWQSDPSIPRPKEPEAAIDKAEGQ
jgi:hypothetical protein